MSLNLKRPRALLINDLKYIIKTNIWGYFQESGLYIQSAFSHTYSPTTKFIVFSSGRSGSTLLVSLLNAHPKIHCDGEILKNKVLAPQKVIRTRASRCDHSIWGFKLLSYQLKTVQSFIPEKRAFLEELINEDYRILYLERANRLNQALSLLYAMYRHKWHQKQGQQIKSPPINVDKQYLAYLLKELDKLNTFEKEILSDLPYYHIHYEKDLENIDNREVAMNGVYDYLDLPAFKSATNLRKITPKQPRQYIENYDEVKTFLKATPYDRFLVD